jgi:hypothetical protein
MLQFGALKKNDEIGLSKELEKMLERIRDENTALHRLIEELRRSEELNKKEIIKKSNH